MSEPVARLVEHFFRHESGRLVAVLARLFGLRHLDLVEDMVQSALVEALQTWRTHGVPENPSAWIHAVARNRVHDALRRRDILLRIAPAWARLRPASIEPRLDDLLVDTQIEDSVLRLIFACCHPVLSRENQIAITLKSLCGFTNAEIAHGLLVSEESVKKRLQRARAQLVEEEVELEVPAAGELPARLDAVHQCLYLLFNEGYAPTSGEMALRVDLCEEAARLCHVLCSHSRCRSPETFALLALMLFHAARFDARTDSEGRLLLLEEQDRSKWDHKLIERARNFLDLSAEGRSASVFHLEAGIALLHCSAPTYAATDWPAILKLFDLLVSRQSSPIYRLNRGIVVAHVHGPQAGIEAIKALQSDPALADYHLVDAALGELNRRAGNLDEAREHFRKALIRARSAPDRELLHRRLAACENAATECGTGRTSRITPPGDPRHSPGSS